MNFLKLSTMEYPRQEADIRFEYPEIREDQTGDTFPLPADYVEVEQTTPPSFDYKTQYLTQSAPTQNNGVWQSVWVVNNKTQKEIDEYMAANAPRQKKNSPSLNNSGSTPNVIE